MTAESKKRIGAYVRMRYLRIRFAIVAGIALLTATALMLSLFVRGGSVVFLAVDSQCIRPQLDWGVDVSMATWQSYVVAFKLTQPDSGPLGFDLSGVLFEMERPKLDLETSRLPGWCFVRVPSWPPARAMILEVGFPFRWLVLYSSDDVGRGVPAWWQPTSKGGGSPRLTGVRVRWREFGGSAAVLCGAPWLALVILRRVVCFRSRRRGQCEACGYPVSVRVSERCPECGSAIRVSRSPPVDTG